jgi:hypothetical protein
MEVEGPAVHAQQTQQTNQAAPQPSELSEWQHQKEAAYRRAIAAHNHELAGQLTRDPDKGEAST